MYLGSVLVRSTFHLNAGRRDEGVLLVYKISTPDHCILSYVHVLDDLPSISPSVSVCAPGTSMSVAVGAAVITIDAVLLCPSTDADDSMTPIADNFAACDSNATI